MFPRIFIDAMDTHQYNGHHKNGNCHMNFLKDPHCYCRLLELLVIFWAYYTVKRVIHNMRGHEQVKWLYFTLLKSMDKEMVEEDDTKH